MFNKKFLSRLIIAAVFCLLNTFSSKAADVDSTKNNSAGEYSLVLYAGGGYSKYANSNGIPKSVPTDATKSGFGGTIRLMWHPDHLLRLGLETGRIPFYSYKIEDPMSSGELTLSAVPIMIEWSMPITKRINIFVGYGIYLMNSKLDFYGETVSKTNSLGYLIAANYIHPIAENLGLAGEVKWMNANETKNDVLNLQVQLVWKFFKW